MKKLYLAVMFLLAVCGEVRADLHGDFLRIECNQDLGLLELRSDVIWGNRMGLYFEQMKPFYKYSIDTSGDDESHAEIMLINSFGNDELPITYRCQLGDRQLYDVYVDFFHDPDCDSADSRASFTIKIVENLDDEKVLVDNFRMGCASPVDGIQLTVGNKVETADITFIFDSQSAYYMGDDIDKPISLEKLKDEREKKLDLYD